MKAHQSAIGKTDVWLTPRWLLEPLGRFDLDPAASIDQPWPTADHHYTEVLDGLAQSWFGRVWLNPPFNRYQRGTWMRRMAEHGNGIMLVPAACETEAFRRYVFGAADGLLMLSRRPHFCDQQGVEAKANSGCTICLVAYGESNGQVLRESGLGIYLKEAA